MKSNFHKNVLCVDAEPPLVEDAAGVQLFCVFEYLSICIVIFVYIFSETSDSTNKQSCVS